MISFFTKRGELISPHLDHVLKSYNNLTDVGIRAIDKIGNVLGSVGLPIGKSSVIYTHTEDIHSFILTRLDTSFSNKDTYVYTNDHIHYAVAPIFFNKEYRGSLIAGPYLINEITQDMINNISFSRSLTIASKHILRNEYMKLPIKAVPRNYYLGQLLHHLMSSAIYIGHHHIEDEDEDARTMDNSLFGNSFSSAPALSVDNIDTQLQMEREIITRVKSGKVNEATELYMKSLNVYEFNDIGNGCSLRSVKNHMISLAVLVNRAVIDSGAESNNLRMKNSEFINKIEQAACTDTLLRLGKKIIKYYCSVVREDFSGAENKLIRKAVSYIQDNFSEELHLKDVCCHVHLSKNYFCNKFKSYTGLSFSKYLNKVRIEKSKEMLKSTSLSILDVSVAVGFNNQTYFSSMFKNQIGTTPKQFRNSSFEIKN